MRQIVCTYLFLFFPVVFLLTIQSWVSEYWPPLPSGFIQGLWSIPSFHLNDNFSAKNDCLTKYNLWKVIKPCYIISFLGHFVLKIWSRPVIISGECIYKRIFQLLKLHKATLNVPTLKDFRNLKSILIGYLVTEVVKK